MIRKYKIDEEKGAAVVRNTPFCQSTLCKLILLSIVLNALLFAFIRYFVLQSIRTLATNADVVSVPRIVTFSRYESSPWEKEW